MIQTEIVPVVDILVAASVTEDEGFDATSDALRRIAMCSLCKYAISCSGSVCTFKPAKHKPPTLS